jgi:predicted ester cyclase
MGASENKALVRRIFEEGMNQQRPEVFDQLLAPSFENHDMPAPVPGPEGFRMVFGMFQAAFPDMQVTLEEVLATDDDKVVTRGAFTGTHKGEFMGVAASGAQIEVKFIDIWRVEGHKVAENWVRLDLLGLMQQIGAVPR